MKSSPITFFCSLIKSMTMTKEERAEFRKILKDCQDINGDNAFDILVNFIIDNLNAPNHYEFSKKKQKAVDSVIGD